MLEKGEINYLWLDRDKGHLYAGCGDNNVYGINLEDGKVFSTLKAHTNYVHCIDGSDNRLVSASEDGTVKFWDLRSNQATQSIMPSQNEKLNRPEYGKWIGTVSLNDDWLLLGGGPRASLWHTRSLESTAFTFPERVHVSGFLDDNIMFGGESKILYHFNYSGQVTSEIPVSSSAVYSVVWQNDTHKCMAIGGASNNVDICTNFGYKDLVLSCYEKK
jgi:THO complex subunit 6